MRRQGGKTILRGSKPGLVVLGCLADAPGKLLCIVSVGGERLDECGVKASSPDTPPPPRLRLHYRHCPPACQEIGLLPLERCFWRPVRQEKTLQCDTSKRTKPMLIERKDYKLGSSA